jgi:ribosomal protein L7/L12
MATSISREDVVEFISNMTVLELSDFVKELEEKFGVTAAAPVAMVAGGAPAGQAQEEVEEQTEFNVVLTAVGRWCAWDSQRRRVKGRGGKRQEGTGRGGRLS